MRNEPLHTASRRSFLKTSALGACALVLPTGLLAKSMGLVLPDDFLNAVAQGDLQRVRVLLAADPSLLFRTDLHGRSAYALAYVNGHEDVGVYLQEQGYESDLHEAALALDWERFESLAAQRSPQVNADHPIGGTTMHAAAIGGAGTNIWHVYAAGGWPNENPRRIQGTTPLQAALRYRDLAVAELTAATLLGNDADPNPLLNAEPPPLHMAAERGSLELVEMLIHFGADINARDAQGRRAVEYAERASQQDVLAMLEQADAIPRVYNTKRGAVDVEGNIYSPPNRMRLSVLEQGNVVGSAHGNMDALQNSIAAEPALVHAMATTGERAVEAGAHMGNLPIVSYLLERGAPYALTTAVVRNDLNRVKAMLADDPKRIQERGAHGFSLLSYPIIGQTGLDMMELLLAHGADIERQHDLGTTALHWACRGRSTDLVALLLENGANPNRIGRKFRGTPMTPLQIAQAAGRSNIVKLLRDHGAQ